MARLEPILNPNEVRNLFEQARANSTGASPTPSALAEPVDILADDRHLRSIVPTLQIGYARLAGNLRRVLTSVLRTRVDIRDEEPELLSGRGLVSVADAAAALLVLRVETEAQVPGYAVLAVDRPFAFAIIERIFGGGSVDELAPSERQLTPLESRMLARALTPFLETLNTSLEPAGFFRFAVHAIESRIDLVPGFMPDMTLLHAPFTMMIGSRLASFSLAKPATVLECLRTRLSEQAAARGPSMMPTVMRNVNVDISVELGSVSMSLRQVLNLAPGMVLPLNRGRNELLPVSVGGVAKFHAVPIQDDGVLAIEIAGRQS